MRKRARLMVLTVPLYTAIGRITTALDDEVDDAADADDDADAGAETIVRLLSLYRVAIVLLYFRTSFDATPTTENEITLVITT